MRLRRIYGYLSQAKKMGKLLMIIHTINMQEKTMINFQEPPNSLTASLTLSPKVRWSAAAMLPPFAKCCAISRIINKKRVLAKASTLKGVGILIPTDSGISVLWTTVLASLLLCVGVVLVTLTGHTAVTMGAGTILASYATITALAFVAAALTTTLALGRTATWLRHRAGEALEHRTMMCS
jgi:hypothetical protein